MTYRNAKGQFCEDPAEAAARKAAFVQNEIDDIEAAGRQRMVGSLLLGCALLLGALIGAGGMWYYMHNDLATGYRLGRIQGRHDRPVERWDPNKQEWGPCHNTLGGWVCDDPTAQGSEVK